MYPQNQPLNPEYQHIIVLGVLLAITVSLFFQRLKPTFVFSGAILLLVLIGVTPVDSLLTALGNKSILTIFLLIFITNALRKHFNLLGLLDRLFKSVKSPKAFMVAMTSSVGMISSAINNTPIVALMIPYVYNWSKKHKVAPSKLLMPLSFAATLGGTITVIGTSTNLVLNGLLESAGFEELGFFDFFIPGILVTIFGVLYLATLGWKLLPNIEDAKAKFTENSREYIVETLVQSDSKLIGKSVQNAGLRNLEGIFLVEILRQKRVIAPVEPNEVIQSNDLLYFAGDVNRVVELLNNDNGLEIPKKELLSGEGNFEIIEVLIPATSDLAGMKVRHSNFRETFDAAIVAVHRNGRKLGGKIGEVQLEYGDLLLLTAGTRFRQLVNGNKSLYVVSELPTVSNDLKKSKKVFSFIALLSFIALGFGWIDFFKMLLILSGSMVATGLLTVVDFRKDFNPDLLLILVSAVCLGTTLIDTGTAHWMSTGFGSWLSGFGPEYLLIGVILLTVFLTSFVTNVAAVAVAFPVVAAFIGEGNLNGEPFFLGIAFAASCAFLTPVSYQTNLMVYGPGGYRSKDFFVVGLPLTILYLALVIGYLLTNYELTI